jgi:prolyl-tRNA synthetase
MDDKNLFLQFWDKEAAATRKVISRIPEGSTYRPDPKSRTAREIAWLIVREEQVRAGAVELLMPTLQLADLWRESGRYDAYGPEILPITHRHEPELPYGRTHEEIITAIFRR